MPVPSTARSCPGTFAVFSLSPDLKLGFAVKSPFGARISYPSDWVGRYQSIDSNLTDIAVEPSLAYAITRQLSIGGGPVIDYISTRQTQNILPAIGYQFGDIYADAHGEDYGFGYNVSALYQFDDDTRLGLSYRSRIEPPHRHETDSHRIARPRRQPLRPVPASDYHRRQFTRQRL